MSESVNKKEREKYKQHGRTNRPINLLRILKKEKLKMNIVVKPIYLSLHPEFKSNRVTFSRKKYFYNCTYVIFLSIYFSKITITLYDITYKRFSFYLKMY